MFLYYNQEEATRAAKSFPLTVGIHKKAKVPATKTTPEVGSLELAAIRAKELETQTGFTTTYLPSGHVFRIIQDRMMDGLDGNVAYLTHIQLPVGNIDAWVVNGATWERYQEVPEYMVENGKIV